VKKAVAPAILDTPRMSGEPIDPERWGEGLATELANASVRVALDVRARCAGGSGRY
jgi:hypothetical protein